MDKLEKKKLRKQFSSLGWALLIYMLIMNLMVSIVSTIDSIVFMLRNFAEITQGLSGDALTDSMMESMLGNGWGYVLSIVTGLLLLRFWKGKQFCREELWTRGRPMDFEDFFSLLSIFISGQLIFQVCAAVQERILNQFGLSAMEAIEMASMSADTFSMFFYMGILAPVAEEILFRGLVLRILLPHGKRFAILLSAFLFGIFHGNLVQTPYAFCVGLVLGYVAVEHNMVWAMVLHMINNLVLGDMLTRLTASLPVDAANIIVWTVIIAFSICAAVIAIRRRKDIAAYIRENKVADKKVACFFTAPGIIALTAFMFANIALALLMQLI